MIPSLKHSAFSFGSNISSSPRESYEKHIGEVALTAQEQNNIVQEPSQPSPIRPIPMQGTGQKLDLIA